MSYDSSYSRIPYFLMRFQHTEIFIYKFDTTRHLIYMKPQLKNRHH